MNRTEFGDIFVIGKLNGVTFMEPIIKFNFTTHLLPIFASLTSRLRSPSPLMNRTKNQTIFNFELNAVFYPFHYSKQYNILINMMSIRLFPQS
jgi:hypothetical protein